MELRDFIVTPIIIALVYLGAYLVRPYLTDSVNRKYFLPALSVRIVGAIALGLLYQFYYSGGDTFNYHTLGSRVVWEAFMKDPILGLRLIFGTTDNEIGIYDFSSRILFFRDPSSYFVIRIASFFDLITFSTYSATAVLFAVISFMGGWMLFLTFYQKHISLHFPLALATLFIPSLIFWGSGILKDTIVLAALGSATYCIDRFFIQKKRKAFTLFLLLLSLFIVFEIKKFILQAFIPSAILWVYFKNLMAIRSTVLRILILPAFITIIAGVAYWTVVKIGAGDTRYSVDRLAHTAKITAYDIGFFTGRDAGSGYSLGEQSGTFSDMMWKAPAAINVTLFRPYFWEVKNPLMFLSAVESFIMLALVVYILFTKNKIVAGMVGNPDIIFLLTVSIIMAFAVGITSYNFGTLSRYKIPILPFFTVALILLNYANRERKLAALEETE